MMASPDWLHYANVRFTMCVPAKAGNPSYARDEIRLTRELGCDVLVFFVQNEGLLLYPDGVSPQDPAVGGRDLLAEIVGEAKKEGVRIVAGWFGAHCQTHQVKTHPAWRVCRLELSGDETGGEMSIETASYELDTVCFNSPFRDHFLAEVREVLSGYDVAGVYVDGMYSSVGTCCCEHCRRKYRAEHGEEIPLDAWSPAWRDFGFQMVVDVSREIRGIIDEVKPGAVFVQDCHGTIIGYREAGEPIFLTAPYVDAYMLECYWNIIQEPPWYVGMESRLIQAETGRPVWSPKWIARNPDRDYALVPPAAVKIWMMEAVISGASPVIIDQGAFWFDRTAFPALQDGCAHLLALRSHLMESRPARFAAILHSMESKFIRQHQEPRNDRQHFEAFYMACQEAHIPFDVTTEEQILDGTVGKYPVLILPNVEYMSDGVVKAVQRYVEGGGGLVMTHLTGRGTETGRERNDLPLAGLAGVRFTGEVLLNGKPEGEKGSTNYYQAVTEHPITEGMDGNTYSFRGRRAVIEAENGTHVLIRARDYASPPGRDSDSYFRWFPGPVTEPLVTVHEAGGRVVYIAGELDAAFWSSGWPEAGRILSRSVIHAADQPLPYTTDCPEPVLISKQMNDSDGTVVFLLVNYATNHLYSVGFPGAGVTNVQDLGRANDMRYAIAHKDIVITLPGEFRQADSITGQALSLETANGSSTVRLPRLDEYEAIILRP